MLFSRLWRKVCCTLVFNFALFSDFCFACFASQTSGLCRAFPSAPVKPVSYTLLLRFSQNFVLRVLPHKHRLCAWVLARLPSSLLHACVYFALFSNFLLYVFCLTNIGLVQCFSLRLPSLFTPFWFSLFYSVCFCCACFAQQSPVCAVIFPRLPSNLHALFFALYYSVLSLCSAFFPSLI